MAALTVGVALLVRATGELPTGAKLQSAPEVVAYGHAHVTGGRSSKWGLARFRHELRLLDGRTVDYVTDRVLNPHLCLEVRAREYRGRLYIRQVREVAGPCEEYDLGVRTR